MKKLLKLLLATVVLGGAGPVQAATLEEIQDKGELVVGMNAEYAPFEWVEMVDGKSVIKGIDPDLAQLIADEIGVELVIDNRAFDALIPTLQTNKIDIILTGMSNTEERQKAVDFSIPYYLPVSVFAVPKDQVDNYKSLEDFNGKKVGVLITSSQETYMKDNMPDVELVSYGKNGDLPEAIKAGKVDAIFVSDLTLQQYMANYGDIMTIVEGVEVDNESLGFSAALQKGNDDLMEVVNKVIQDAIDSGKLEEIIADNVAAAGKLEDE